MSDIAKQIIDSLQGGLNAIQGNDPIRGWVWCRECGNRKKVNASECFRSGWPKCCDCTMTIDVPAKDCKNCLYSQEDWADGGHCYMFKDAPTGDNCGQFKPLNAK